MPLSITPEVTTFTGGDPTGFCAGWTSAEEVIGAWAEAGLMAASSSEEGLADLAYGEGAAQALDAVADVAPAEVVQALAPTLSRAHAAVDAIRALGEDDATIDQDARAVVESSAGGTEADGETPATLEADRTQFLRATFGADRVNAAARAFAQSHPPEAGLFDLGNYSAAAARTAGYDCLVPPRPIARRGSPSSGARAPTVASDSCDGL